MGKDSILIVDDNAKNIQVLANILAAKEFDIEYCLNGKSAIDWVKKKQFDLILLDIMMPEMDGYTACAKIKEIPEAKDIPVIFITAKTDIESLTKAFDIGGIDYITKPFNKRELLARVCTHLEIQILKKEISKLYKDLKNGNDNMIESVNYALNIQKSALTSDHQLNTIIPDNFLIYRPKDIIGGDFYWVKERHNNLYIVIGDCTGHGIPGAMLTMLVINTLNHIFFNYLDLQANEFLELLKKDIMRFTSVNENFMHDSVDLSLCIINKYSNKIQFSGANSQIIIAKKEINSSNNTGISLKLYKGTKNTVGYNLSELDFINHEIQLNPDDTIYLFSDGISDQFGGPKGKKFKLNQLIKLFEKNGSKSLQEQKIIFENTLDKWQNDLEQVDDITLLAFCIPENINNS